eukprot:gnl/MRDRNA2_/MRDRNA2_109108_c0_seq1.p1 gnl/MRDRNA2_/MRDRNA2_109108_c0~~gnl/MRDRNA2_/MRDRNA2_109108_c0_seq1.p1  ORF type:complete len:273 (+),score=35.73 gnl/MRDRNA2_/MRDRNA2_109108_c0_seq1:85-903(+)
MEDMDDFEDEKPSTASSERIAPGCCLGSTLGSTQEGSTQEGSTTLNSTSFSAVSSELPAGEITESFSLTLMDGWPCTEMLAPSERAGRPQTADPSVLENLRKAIEADTELLPGGGSELHQRTYALRQRTLDLIARDSSLGSYQPPGEVDVGYLSRNISTAPHCARPGFNIGQCPHPSYMRTDASWKEQCVRERKYFLPSAPQTLPQDIVESRPATGEPVAPRSKRNDKAGSRFGPRPAVRRVGHGPRGGAFPRTHVALLGGVPTYSVDLENH